MKKIISLIMVVILMNVTGCLGGSETDKKSDENLKNPDKVNMIIDSTNIDADLILTINSNDRPPTTGALKTENIIYGAKYRDDRASDLIYEYSFEEGGNLLETKVQTNSLEKVFYNLKAETTYKFTVLAYDKLTKKVSEAKTVQFITGSEGSLNPKTPFMEKVTFDINLDKKIVFLGETLTIKFTVENSDKKEYKIEPYVDLLTRDGWEFVSSDAPEILEKESGLVTFKEVYKLNKIVGTKTIQVGSSIKSGGEILPIQNNNIDVLDGYNTLILESATASAKNLKVLPGQSGIQVTYVVNNKTTNSIEITDIESKFTDSEGNDVSSEWSMTTTDFKTAFTGSRSTLVSYTLSQTATTGTIYLDAVIKGEIDGIEIVSGRAISVGKLTVGSVPEASLELWTAYPEGAKDGTISLDQEITIYGKVNYSGTERMNDGKLRLRINGLDGTRPIEGTVDRDIKANEQMEWVIKAGKEVVEGNIELYVTQTPTIGRSPFEENVEFISKSVKLELKVEEEPKLHMSTIYINDYYGGNDGIVKLDSTFKAGVKLENATKNEVSGNVRVKIVLSDIDNPRLNLAPGENFIKEGAVGEELIWDLVGRTVGRENVTFEVLSLPNDENRDEVVALTSDSEYKLFYEVIKGPKIKLLRIFPNVDSMLQVDPGDSGIVVRMEVQNSGDVDLRVTDLNLTFTQKGEELSDKWKVTAFDKDMDLTKGMIAEVRAYVSLMENIGDDTDIIGDVTIDGNITVMDVDTKEIVTASGSIQLGKIRVEDIIDPTPVIGAPETALVGEEITFDATESTDNVEIRHYYWDFNYDPTATYNHSDRAGEKVIKAYDTPGIYIVKLRLIDAAGNDSYVTHDIIIKEEE